MNIDEIATHLLLEDLSGFSGPARVVLKPIEVTLPPTWRHEDGKIFSRKDRRIIDFDYVEFVSAKQMLYGGIGGSIVLHDYRNNIKNAESYGGWDTYDGLSIVGNFAATLPAFYNTQFFASPLYENIRPKCPTTGEAIEQIDQIISDAYLDFLKKSKSDKYYSRETEKYFLNELEKLRREIDNERAMRIDWDPQSDQLLDDGDEWGNFSYYSYPKHKAFMKRQKEIMAKRAEVLRARSKTYSEQEIAQSRAKFNNLLKQVAYGYIVTKKFEKILTINPANIEDISPI